MEIYTDDRLPILAAVAYPSHLLGVPQELWLVNMVASSIIALVIGAMTGSGVQVEAMFVSMPLIHCLFMYFYYRDPHVARVWRAAAGGAPQSALLGTRNLLPKRRRVNRFVA
jgi:hypothetical protein